MSKLFSGTEGALQINTADIADDAVTLAKLSATGTPSSSNFLRGDNTFAAAGGGKILQVVQDEITATVTVTGSTSFVDVTNLAVAITPASSSNKVLISGVLRVSTQSGTGPTVKLVRDSTDIHLGDASGSYERGLWGATQMSTDVERQMFQIPVFFLDSPSTTSEVTYKFQARVDHTSHTLYVNRFYRASDAGQEPRTASNLVAMEIES